MTTSSSCGSEHVRKKTNGVVACLLTCCIFFFIICVCLVTALVFLGRHILYTSINSTQQNLPARKISAPFSLKSYKRLPNDTKPLLYDLTLFPDLTRGLYKGSVNITLEIERARNDIIIHSKNLTISEIILKDSENRELQVLIVNEIVNDEVLVITTKKLVSPGLYFLFLRFDAIMFGKFHGIYRSQYKTANGEIRYLLLFVELRKLFLNCVHVITKYLHEKMRFLLLLLF